MRDLALLAARETQAASAFVEFDDIRSVSVPALFNAKVKLQKPLVNGAAKGQNPHVCVEAGLARVVYLALAPLAALRAVEAAQICVAELAVGAVGETLVVLQVGVVEAGLARRRALVHAHRAAGRAFLADIRGVHKVAKVALSHALELLANLVVEQIGRLVAAARLSDPEILVVRHAGGAGVVSAVVARSATL